MPVPEFAKGAGIEVKPNAVPFRELRVTFPAASVGARAFAYRVELQRRVGGTWTPFARRDTFGDFWMRESERPASAIREACSKSERDLALQLCKFNEMMDSAYEELAPHKICSYIYELSDAFNSFYHEIRILAEEDTVKRAGYIALLRLTVRALETGIELLGFAAPERM